MDDLEVSLQQGINQLGLVAEPAQSAKLLAFVRLMVKWNRVYNLTSIDRPADMVKLHLLDSVAILPYLQGERILDVGTGAGLPGIPLAILDPARKFVLLDSNSKKTRFVTQAAIELGLRNVSVQHVRVEKFCPSDRFDTVLCRAFTSLAEIVAATRRLLNPGGTVVAQKGRLPVNEIGELTLDFDVASRPLGVPGLEAERHVVIIKV